MARSRVSDDVLKLHITKLDFVNVTRFLCLYSFFLLFQVLSQITHTRRNMLLCTYTFCRIYSFYYFLAFYIQKHCKIMLRFSHTGSSETNILILVVGKNSNWLSTKHVSYANCYLWLWQITVNSFEASLPAKLKFEKPKHNLTC